MAINHYLSLFLDAPSHLYKRVCPSVRPSVRPSVSIKGKRGLGASYVGYPALFSRYTYFFGSSYFFIAIFFTTVVTRNFAVQRIVFFIHKILTKEIYWWVSFKAGMLQRGLTVPLLPLPFRLLPSLPFSLHRK